jgi:hypothetical protein
MAGNAAYLFRFVHEVPPGLSFVPQARITAHRHIYLCARAFMSCFCTATPRRSCAKASIMLFRLRCMQRSRKSIFLGAPAEEIRTTHVLPRPRQQLSPGNKSQCIKFDNGKKTPDSKMQLNF